MRVTKGPEEQLEQISKRKICLKNCLDLIYLVKESFLYLFIPGGGPLIHKVSYATTSSVEFTRPLSTCYLVRQRSTSQTVYMG